jgi:hypothetical protein
VLCILAWKVTNSISCGQTGHFARECPEPKKNSGECFNCGETGHNKADCPQPRKMGACFNCGDEGHNKAECPKPRVANGPCRVCEEEGHVGAQCPQRKCRVCNEKGKFTYLLSVRSSYIQVIPLMNATTFVGMFSRMLVLI